MSAAESATLVRVRSGAGAVGTCGGGCDWGWGVGDLTLSAEAPEALPLPLLTLELELALELELELELSLPMARWIKPSTVVAALLLSFAALPLTAWICVRFFRVVGDCRRRSVREGCAGGGSIWL